MKGYPTSMDDPFFPEPVTARMKLRFAASRLGIELFFGPGDEVQLWLPQGATRILTARLDESTLTKAMDEYGEEAALRIMKITTMVIGDIEGEQPAEGAVWRDPNGKYFIWTQGMWVRAFGNDK